MKKSKWLIFMLVAVMVLSLALSGCGSSDSNEPAPPADEGSETPSDEGSSDEGNVDENTPDEEKLAAEQVLRLNWGSNPPDLDPQTSTDQVSFWIINAVYEGLVRLQPDGSVVKGSGLAEDWEISEDGLKYTFKLRDAKWSDGTPITAEDFEYAWKRAVDPNTASEYAYQFYCIKNGEKINKKEITDLDQLGVKAIDEKTLEVELERPTPYFLSLTSFITYIPAQKAAVEKFGEEFASAPDKMVYSGPFIIDEWVQERSLNLVKNPNYWDADNVTLEKIEGSMITENNTIVNLYDSGELDVIGVPSEFLEKYKDTDEFKSFADATTWYIQYNMEDEYFSNYNIRKAFSLAIDKQTFVDKVLANGSLVAEGLTPPLLPGKDGKEFAENRGKTMPDFNVEEAKKALEQGLQELGITKEQLQEHTTFLTGESTTALRYAQAIQQMWKQNLGIEVTIEPVTFAIRLDRYNKKDYTTTFAGWGGDYNDPMTFMDLFVTNGGNNDAYYSNPEYDEAIQIAVKGQGDERIDAMLKAEELLARDLPIYPIYHPARNVVQRSYVKGIARFPVGVDSEYKWVKILEH